jgi:hypothetical protein
MKRKIYFLIGLVGLIIIVVALLRFFGSRGLKQGELRIDSQPLSAVFLDNKNIGKTPYRDKIAAGDHVLKLIPDTTTTQLVNWEGKITVGQNLLTYVNANLSESELTTAIDIVWLEKITSKQSELSVTTSPDGATVLVDDVTRGVTPLSISDIVTGDHSVNVTSVGFLTRSLKVKTTPGYRLIANLKLALSGASPAPEVTATGTPAPSGKLTPSPKLSPTKVATSSASQMPDPVKPFIVIKDTPTGFLRVRIEPSTSATEAGRVNPGEKYTIMDTKSGWYQIKYDAKNSGWVSGQYTDKVE